jgi:hypothetical protein
MPDSMGVLSQAERDTVAAAMRAKSFSAPCPWCGSPNWEVGPSVVASVPVVAGGALAPSGKMVPQVMLVSPCGYIASFAARLVGLNI